MKRKMYWGVAILILLLGTVAVFIIQHELAENSKLNDQLKDAAKLANQIEQEKMSENNASPKGVVDDSQQIDSRVGGDLSDVQKTDDTSDVQETEGTPDWSSLTPEQRQAIFDQYYIQIGLKPPPLGYTYRWEDIDVPLLDENGNPVLHKIGEPEVNIKMGIGFAPTREELEQYNQLHDDAMRASALGNDAEYERLLAEIDAFEASVQRMRPIHVGTLAIGSEARSKVRRVTREKMNAALREHGLGHLIED